MYNIATGENELKDFTKSNCEFIDIVSIEEMNEEHDTYEIEIEDNHYFQTKSSKNEKEECIISHNSATIVFGKHNDKEYINLKNYKKNPHREAFGWTSNNSIFAELGMDYDDVAERTMTNGEPGYVWLDNIQAYSRMDNVIDNKDHRASGCNPCFSGDTLIAVADGRHAVSIKQLAEEGKDVPVYSIDDRKVVVKMGRKPRMTRKSQQLYKITLDDGSIIRATDNHEFMKLSGEMVRLDHLNIGDSLFVKLDYDNSKESCLLKISNIEKNLIEDVYCLTVDDTHKVCVILQTKDSFNLICASNCAEQSLESYELCCLVETFPAKHESLEDYKRTLKFAYLYAKTVTLGKTHWPETNRVMLRNRRIGCSMSGIAQFIAHYSVDQLKNWCQEGYKELQNWDQIYSDWFAIPKSIKISSVKPSGCQIPNTVIKTNLGNKTLYQIFLENGVDLSEKQNEYREWYDVKKDIFVKDNNNEDKKITKLFINGIGETLLFTMEDGSLIECTPNHKFLMKNGNWKEAKDITFDDDFKLKSKTSSIAFTVDIEVEDSHCYQLENGIVSHNSISLLVGATPGIHHPESRFYIRRMRLSKFSDLVEPLKKANYVIEPANEDIENTVVVELPVDVGEGVRTASELTMWEQAALASLMQRYWADNQVSCTITFNPVTEGQHIKHLLDYFQYQLKGISFLPRKEKGAYKQMPYEAIDEETYKNLIKKIKPIKFEKVKNEKADVERFCNNDVCEIKPVK